MNINNNQWTTIVLITAALMLVFLIFVFYDNKKAAELPPGTPVGGINVLQEQANPSAAPSVAAPATVPEK